MENDYWIGKSESGFPLQHALLPVAPASGILAYLDGGIRSAGSSAALALLTLVVYPVPHGRGFWIMVIADGLAFSVPSGCRQVAAKA
jgi:hypothetical protein